MPDNIFKDISFMVGVFNNGECVCKILGPFKVTHQFSLGYVSSLVRIMNEVYQSIVFWEGLINQGKIQLRKVKNDLPDLRSVDETSEK